MFTLKCLLSHLRQSQRKIATTQRVISVKQYIIQPRFYTTQDDLEAVISTIGKGDKDLEKKLRIYMLEVEVMRQDGRYAPSTLTLEQWEHLVVLNSRNQRTNYLQYLWKNEIKRENDKTKRAARKKEYESQKMLDTREYPDDFLYGIQNQSLFTRIRDQSINNFDNYRALQAMMGGQSIVIDCSYEEHMVWRETVNAAKQMTLVFGDNRIHKEPFNIHMCNVNLNGEFMKQLRKNIPSLEEPWFPMNIHTESYLDLFPKEKLVYLTPHCRTELTHYDDDAVYIIGCMVDKMNNEPLSLAKAKRDKIKMAKLPLDRYLEWAPGSKKNLNINHMVPILLDLKLTRDWEFSLQHIPRRKLMETKILAMQKRLKNNPMLQDDIFKNFQKNNLRRDSVYSLRKKNPNSRRSLHDE